MKRSSDGATIGGPYRALAVRHPPLHGLRPNTSHRAWSGPDRRRRPHGSVPVDNTVVHHSHTCGIAPEGHWCSVGIVDAMPTYVVDAPKRTVQLSSVGSIVLVHYAPHHTIFQR